MHYELQAGGRVHLHAVTLLAERMDGRALREIEPGLYSVFPADTPAERYDKRARAYDRMIGSRLYNRVAWGSSPDEYRTFARRAVASSASGWLLDAGCGTLLLTADAYLEAPERPIIALDRSLGMLRRARERLTSAAGTHPPHVVLLQADLLDLPFRPGQFQTVLSMGMLHLFDDVDPLLSAFTAMIEPGGELFLSSLVENGRRGDAYMRFLHRAGELAAPRSAGAMQSMLQQLPFPITFSVSGNMAYATLSRIP